MANPPMRRVFEHRADSFPQGGDLSFYFTKETVLRTFEDVVAGDFVEAISVEGETQKPERLSSEARSALDRMPKGTKAGRIDHGEVTLRSEIRPPGELTGASQMMGYKLFEAAFGEARIVNSQAKLAIDSVVSHGVGGTVIRCTVAEELLQLGDGIAIRSRNAFSTALNHEQAVICGVAFEVGGAGTMDFTLWPKLSSEPVTTGATPDQIQGGVTFKATKAWGKTFSAVWHQGFSGEMVEGGICATVQVNFDARSILTADFGIHYRRAMFAGIGFVRGESGTDAFLTTDTVVDVDDASLFSNDQYVNLYKFNPSTEALILKETKAKISDRNLTSSPNTLTIARGSTPVSQTGGTQDLKVVTLAAQEVAETIVDTVLGDFIAVELDHRGLVEVPLTVKVGYAFADLMADVNTYLKHHEDYGQASDVIAVSGINYGACASDAGGGELRLTSQAFGAQSQVRLVNTQKSGDQFSLVWNDPGSPPYEWNLEADSGIQIEAWHPEGTNDLDTIVNIDGICRAHDAKFLFATAAATFGNQADHIEDVRTKKGDHFETGHLAGLERVAQIAVSQPAFGWTERLRNMSIENEGIPVLLTTGNSEGSTFGWMVPKATPGDASKSGDIRRDVGYTLTGEDPKVTYTNDAGTTTYTLKECCAFIT